MQLIEVDKIIRKGIKEGGMYGKGMCASRLYIEKKKLGDGLRSIRDECPLELIRTIIYFTWKRGDRIGNMIRMNEGKNGMWNRFYKACGKRLNREELKKLLYKKENGKRDKGKIVKYLKEGFQTQYLNE